ncbi:hypothetical protein [Streptomyces kronopolitis]|uniref:hypothetical protein n=1 Tax=Streptomyces kronopolitis TaxID=1612435 RepID=UPI003D962B80
MGQLTDPCPKLHAQETNVPVPPITITHEFSGSVVAKGANDDLSASLLKHAGFQQISDWHGRRHRLPITTPLADKVTIATHAAEMLRAAHYDVDLPPSLDTARMSPPVPALGSYAAAAELLRITDQIRAAENGADLQGRSTLSFTPSTVPWSASGRRWRRRASRSTTSTTRHTISLTGSTTPPSTSGARSPNSSAPRPSYAG